MERILTSIVENGYYIVPIYSQSLIILAAAVKYLIYTDINNISVGERILTSIVENGTIVYQYIHNLSNNSSSRCEVSDKYVEK